MRVWAAIVIRARAIFLLLLANATASIATTRLAVRHDIVASGIPAKRLIARHSVSGSKLDFQLDDFVPLLIGAITLGDRQEVTQATTRIGRRRYDNGSFGRIFRIRIIHCNLKKAEPVKDEPRIP